MSAFFKLRKTRFERIYKIVQYSHVTFLFFIIIAAVLLSMSYSFRGFLTDKLFVVLYIATGMILFGLYRNSGRTIRSYYSFFFFLPFLILTGIVIPNIRFASIVFGASLLLDGEHTRYPIDHTFSIQTSRVGVLSGSPTYSLIEQKFQVFEKVTDDIIPKLGVPKVLEVSKINEDSFKLSLLSSEIHNERLDTILSLKR